MASQFGIIWLNLSRAETKLFALIQGWLRPSDLPRLFGDDAVDFLSLGLMLTCPSLLSVHFEVSTLVQLLGGWCGKMKMEVFQSTLNHSIHLILA